MHINFFIAKDLKNPQFCSLPFGPFFLPPSCSESRQTYGFTHPDPTRYTFKCACSAEAKFWQWER
jgi:hypothetical protein